MHSSPHLPHEPSSYERQIYLMPIPEEANALLAQYEAQRTPHAPRPRRRRRWFLRLTALSFLLVLFALLALFEIDIAQEKERQQKREMLMQKLAHGHALDPQSDALPPPKALQSALESLAPLHQIKQQLCGASPQAFAQSTPPFSWLAKLPAAQQKGLQRALTTLPLPLRQSWRSLRLSASKKTTSLDALCQRDLLALQKQRLASFHRAASRLIEEAREALHDYGWCESLWPHYLKAPKMRDILRRLLASGCLASCEERESDLCSTCLQARSLSPSLSLPFVQLLKIAHERRCWQEKPKLNVEIGAFHLGRYYQAIKQLLAGTQVLEKASLCDEACLSYREMWGFSLQITSEPAATPIFLQMWPQRLQPPPHLASLPQEAQAYADGKTYWLPALPTQLPALRLPPLPALTQPAISSASPPSPRKMWYLLRLYDAQSGKQRFLPIAPRPKEQIKQQMPLLPLRLHNDGRAPLRFPSISPDGRYLAFLTYPHANAPRFLAPHCPQTQENRRAQPQRSILSLYALASDGSPQGKGWHQPLYGQIHALQIQQSEQHYNLRISSHGGLSRTPPSPPPQGRDPLSPDAPSTPPEEEQRNQRESLYALWEIPLNFQDRVVFGEPTRATSGQESLPLSLLAQGDTLLALSLACPPPLPRLRLEQQPRPRLHQPPELPEGYALRFGTLQQKDRLALLLQPWPPSAQIDTQRSFLWLPSLHDDPSQPPPPPHALPSPFQQITATPQGLLLAGGGWGHPLASLSLPLSPASSNPSALLPPRPQQSYLDPTYHPSQRVFFLQTTRLDPHRRLDATLLLSLPLPR